MNTVDVSVEGPEDFGLESGTGGIEAFVQSILAEEGRDEWEVSVLICDKDTMARYNHQYRGKEGPTDVLSFPQVESKEEIPSSGPFIAGDILICPDSVRQNALDFGVPYAEEFMRVLVHGILHLGTWDHETNDADEPMLVLQEKILSSLLAKGSNV